jgi:plasmid maintenance system antidote protein VapI
MTLTEYLNREKLSLSAFGALVGVTKGRLSDLNKNGRDWPPDLALKVEEHSGGAVDAAELSTIIARARQVAA